MDEQARRISGFAELDEAAICYWRASDGIWLIYLPRCGVGRLPLHTVTEHEDGTITVRPSVIMRGHASGVPSTRHGFLTRGVWVEC